MKRWLTLLLIALTLLWAASATAETTVMNGPGTYTAQINEEGGYAYFQFTPTVTTVYTFFSELEDGDTYGYLYDADMTQIAYNDDGDSDYNFKLTNTLEGGRTYIYGVRFYDSGETGSFDVTLKPGLRASASGSSERFINESGQTETLTVAAEGVGELTYRWQRNGTELAATGPSVTASLQPNELKASYTCTVTDNWNNEVSVSFHLMTADEITLDNAAEFSVGEEGGQFLYAFTAQEGIEYMFYALSDRSTEATLYDQDMNEINYTTSNYWKERQISRINRRCYANQRYYLVVSVPGGDESDIAVEVGVVPALKVDAVNGSSRSVPLGGSTTLEVSASGARGEYTYQWIAFDENDMYYNMPGETGPTLTLTNVRKVDRYSCYVSAEPGMSYTLSFTVNIDNQFQATQLPGRTVETQPGETVTLTVDATVASGELEYAWQDSTGWIDGATASSHTVTFPASGTSYREFSCRVTDEYGNIHWLYFELEFDNHLSVSRVGPFRVYATLNEEIQLAVSASCDRGLPTYRWYYENEDGNNIDLDANGPSCALTVPLGIEEVYCEVSDAYGGSETVSFEIRIDNGFAVWPYADQYVEVNYGESATLSLRASCDEGALHYEWRNGEQELTEWRDQTTVTVTNITGNRTYWCYVSDDYGNGHTVDFEIAVRNNFRVEAVMDSELVLHPGETGTLAVSASCDTGELTYRWYDEYNETYLSQTGATCEVTGTGSSRYYECKVSDIYGNTAYVGFRVYVDNLALEGDDIRYVPLASGQSVTLDPQATVQVGELHYKWRLWGGDSGDALGTDATFTTPALTSGCIYECEIRDDYDNEASVQFFCAVGGESLELNAPKAVTLNSRTDCAVLRFTPETAGSYRFFSRGDSDPRLWVFQGNGIVGEDDDDGPDNNFLCDCELEAGTAYTLFIGTYNQSMTTTVTVQPTDGGSEIDGEDFLEISLLEGQTVFLGMPRNTYAEDAYLVSGTCVAFDPESLEITANGVGESILSIEQDNGDSWRRQYYRVTVYPAGSKVIAPPAAVIGDEAFMGDTAVQFVRVSEAATSIGVRAFRGSGLKQIIVPGMNTVLRASSLVGTDATILCRRGSAAESYALNHDMRYAYID